MMKLNIQNFCKRIEVEILITKWTTMRFYMTNTIFKGRREKKGKKRAPSTTILLTTISTCRTTRKKTL